MAKRFDAGSSRRELFANAVCVTWDDESEAHQMQGWYSLGTMYKAACASYAECCNVSHEDNCM